MSEYKYLFQPLKVGNLVLQNRVIFGPHVTNHWPNHLPDDRTVAYYEERAKGGVGMIIIGASPVDETANYAPFVQCGLWSDDCIPGLRKIADATHKHGTPLCVQLVHPGIHQEPEYDPDGHVAVAPSEIPAIEIPFNIPKELSVDEIHEIQDKFAAAAERAQKAGLDGVEIHGAHGYLLSAFLTPLKNKRTDQYGGSLENRARFLLEVMSKVRERVGPDFVVGCRISSSDMIDGGVEPEDIAKVAAMMEAADNMDFLHVSVGLYRSMSVMIPSHVSGLEPGYQADLTAEIKAAMKSTPVFMVGRINDPMLVDRLIADGSADACIIVRELIAEPEFVNKARENRIDDIRPCAYWNQSCLAHIFMGMRVGCQMNAAAGNELKLGKDTLVKAATPKRLLIVGAGPAGLETARVAIERGHQVTIFEKGTETGGQLNMMARMPGRSEVRNWMDWLLRQVESSGKGDIRLGSEITAENIDEILAAEAPDEIIVATGARAAADGRSSVTTEPIPGHDLPHVFTYEDLLGAEPAGEIGKRVLIVDELADRIAPGIAQMLADAGHDVEIMTRWPSIGHESLVRWGDLAPVYEALDELGVQTTTDSWLGSIEAGYVTAFNIYSMREWQIDVDTVIFSTMKYANNALAKLIGDRANVPVHLVGDAIAPRQVADAVADATKLAYEI